MRIAQLTFVVLCCGCLRLSPGGVEIGALDAPVDPDCSYYDDSFLAWTAVGATASGLAGAAGTVLAVWPDPPTDAIVGLGAGGAVLGVLGVTADLLAGMYAQRYVERCTGGL